MTAFIGESAGWCAFMFVDLRRAGWVYYACVFDVFEDREYVLADRRIYDLCSLCMLVAVCKVHQPNRIITCVLMCAQHNEPGVF